MWSVLIFAVWHFKYFRTFPLNVKFGEQGSGCDSSFLPCGNWALCLQMSVSVKAWVFSSFPRQSPDQSLEQPVHVAATLAQWHCQLPGVGEAPTRETHGRAQNWNFLQFFHGFDLVPCVAAIPPPLSVTLLVPRPESRESPCLSAAQTGCRKMSTHGENKCLILASWDNSG